MVRSRSGGSVLRESSLGIHTFEDERMNDDPDPEPNTAQSSSEGRSVYEQAAVYRKAKELLYDYDTFQVDKRWAIKSLEELWEEGFSVAAHLLGKVYRDGVEVPQDRSVAKEWFLRSAQAGNDYSQYALGKLLLRLSLSLWAQVSQSGAS